jgi:ATP-dependent helicase/DNAse subunit B
VLDLLRARTRRAEVVFVLGLEEGVLPQRTQPSPFLDEDRRRELDGRARMVKADPVSRARYLFYTACTRPSRRLYLAREAATDDGAPRQASPFWEDVCLVIQPEDVARWTRRRPLSQLVWPIEIAPSERERLRALSWLSTTDHAGADALARANGWERRLDRALQAFDRPTRLTDSSVLDQLRGKSMFGVTELEAFAGCSSIWLVERLLDPKSMDAEVDARMRGSVAHQALFKFFSGLPKRLDAERVPPDRLDEALDFMRECLAEAIATGAEARLELTDLQRRELEQSLWRDLEGLVRAEAESELPLVPRKFEVSFGSDRSAPELQRGLDLGTFHLSGKIDRIDLDPFAARGIVWDYKSGKKAHSATEIERELRLQIPLYMLVLRDLVGVEPLGGLYRPLAGDRKARGLLRATARDDGVPGYSSRDYVDEDDFWAKVAKAEEVARRIVARIREGDVKHDPREGTCPSWCELGSMCRVKRA